MYYFYQMFLVPTAVAIATKKVLLECALDILSPMQPVSNQYHNRDPKYTVNSALTCYYLHNRSFLSNLCQFDDVTSSRDFGMKAEVDLLLSYIKLKYKKQAF